MRLLNRLTKTSVKSYVRHTVTAKVKGHHGVKPPVDDLLLEVQPWVNRLFADWEETLTFELQVECRRIPVARSFYGVRAITVPYHNPCAVELRVRPRGSNHQWYCELVCNNEETAGSLLKGMRPEAVEYVLTHALGEAAEKPPTRQAPIGKQQRWINRYADEYNQASRLVKEVRRRDNLRNLCGRLIAEVENQTALVDRAAVRTALAAVFSCQIPNAVFSDLILEMIRNGVFDPVPDASRLMTTLLFDEYANAYRNRKSQAEHEQLERERERLSRQCAAADRDMQRLQAQLAELTSRKAGWHERIQEIDEAALD